MKKSSKLYIYIFSLFLIIVGYGEKNFAQGEEERTRFPVAPFGLYRYEDLNKHYPIDLRNPSNITQKVEYDSKTFSYSIHTFVGDKEIGYPIVLTREEYLKWLERQEMTKNFQLRFKGEKGEDEESLDVTDLHWEIKPLERIFGPGGVRLRTRGSADLSIALKRDVIENPNLPTNSRKKTFFDFGEKIQLNVNARVGEKVDFNMNYNTETAFDFDSKKMKLAYEGNEDEIIKIIEAGNVSMPSSNSLIKGTQALFGVKTGLQFGKLKLTSVISQQESESKTINMDKGTQLTPFEFTADAYDENKHFFLGQYFYLNYNRWMSQLPYISSGITINRIEVWVTNKVSNYGEARNIVAFLDLGESQKFQNNFWNQQSPDAFPYNKVNKLYMEMCNTYLPTRDMSKVSETLSRDLSVYGVMEGEDFEKVENARKLESSEYKLNAQLGYISLNTALKSDEVLAVAYEYTYRGNTYQVGEFSSDNSATNGSMLFVKLLKSTLPSPHLTSWHLAMKNIYSLSGYNIQSEHFKMDIKYKHDSVGTYTNFLNVGNIRNKILLRVMNLDRLNNRNESTPDGFFDFVEGYTILADKGKIVFPVTEPFGSWLAEKIGDPTLAKQYAYTELYDSTLVYAQQLSEKNKFLLRGEYQASSGGTISLGSMNVPRGSVSVKANGVTLTENVDYTVDYTLGSVTILNQNLLDARTPISVSTENLSTFNMQKKTLFGLDAQYDFSKDFNLTGTFIHLSEKPLTTKVSMGNEAISNTIWGLGISYKTESQWLTNLIDKVPWIHASQPSMFSFQGEVANLIPGHSDDIGEEGYSYIDDFESSQTEWDISSPYAWNLSSTPASFPESSLNNDVQYGKNRSLLAWYRIDNLFTQNTPRTPDEILRDKNQLSDHRIRQVLEQELFPDRQSNYGQISTLPILNLAYYPNERGPYNVDIEGINEHFLPSNPRGRWGGMMRKMDITDFENANFEYIQFWLLDPFAQEGDGKNEGGDLYFNIGEISEDILKDGMKFFESGMPINGDTSLLTSSVWGRTPNKQSLTYAFDNSEGAKGNQDVGLDGLKNEQEFSFPTYATYIGQLEDKLSIPVKDSLKADPFSPFNDPSGDNFRHYLDYGATTILNRYKHFNGTEGNSTNADRSAKTTPDVEDINQDNTLNGNERYYEYKLSIRPSDMVVGKNFISDIKETAVTLANGSNTRCKWYQFKIPLHEYEKIVGNIKDFKSIRFMRVYFTGFEKEIVLRLASFSLVRGDWRTYTRSLNDVEHQPISEASFSVSTMNIEENGNRKPVNYVLPPNISRATDPSQPQLKQLNEQSLALSVSDLAPWDARAVYKNTNLDMRRYKSLQLFTHAEALEGEELRDGDLSIFLRLGTDYTSNYYEYSIPLTLTPHGTYYDNASDRQKVWPKENQFDVKLTSFTNLKLQRNAEKRKNGSGISFSTLYSIPDPNKPTNTISIVGNPTLGQVKNIMIGIRNSSGEVRSTIVWVDELRMCGFDEEGGWAVKGNVYLALSDIGVVNASGQYESAGFGSVEDRVQTRRMDDWMQYNISTSMDIGRLIPEKVKLKAPFYYSVSKEKTTPKYNPLDDDLLLDEATREVSSSQKDSILDYAVDRTTTKSISFSNVYFDVKSKKPMPYDPVNFKFSYAFSETDTHNPTTQYELTQNYKGNISYSYAPLVAPFKPFKKMKSKSKYTRFIKEFGVNYVPNTLSFTTTMERYYYELQSRTLTAGEINSDIPVVYRKDFTWERRFALTWNFTKSLRFDIQTATNAVIDEPDVPVNKRLFPDEYQHWKDSVWENIRSLGRPISYTQVANFSYDLPLSLFPITDWITAGVRYHTSYNWDKGATSQDIDLGNIIKNQGAWQINGQFNLDRLYNKSKFLNDTYKRFNRTNAPNQKEASSVSKGSVPLKSFTNTIHLSKEQPTLVQHNLNSKKFSLTAHKVENGKKKKYHVKYKVKGENEIQILNQDSVEIELSLTPPKSSWKDGVWYDVAQYAARALMMVRNVGVVYKVTNSSLIPYFKPNTGDIFGQRNDGGLVPGLDFAFGFTGEGYLNKAMRRDWLILNDTMVTPASFNRMEELQITASLEPINALKIELNANRIYNDNRQVQFMFENSTPVRGGNFTITTIALSTHFESSSADNNYSSKAFNQLLENRDAIAQRLQSQYNNTIYPQNSFLAGSQWAGRPYNPDNGRVDRNSADVLIPAFFSAYTGRSSHRVDLSPFVALKHLLPNWKMTYGGFLNIPFIHNNFKRFDLTHAYRCVYSVGSFTSYQNWADLHQGDLGFTQDVQSGCPIPSSPYSVSSVAITESFAPLIGLDVTLLNDISFKLEYKDTRTASLNLSSLQVVESKTKEFVIGAGYKIADFRTLLSQYRRKGKEKFSSDLNLKADLSYSIQNAFIRRIVTGTSEPTSGNDIFSLKLIANYALSSALTLSAFYDKKITTPLVSTSSYPISNSDFGVSLKFSLNR